jgi:hypothetical protein
MAVDSSRAFVSYTPVSRERRARRHRMAAVLVIAAVASSSFILQSFYSRPPSVPGATQAAFTYFPN